MQIEKNIMYDIMPCVGAITVDMEEIKQNRHHRTLEEFKKQFDNLDKDTLLEYMYNMAKKLEYIREILDYEGEDDY